MDLQSETVGAGAVRVVQELLAILAPKVVQAEQDRQVL
jgi:hypothetical protein